MKSLWKSVPFFLASATAAILTACGDTVENVYQAGMDVVASEDDLSKCTRAREGDLALVKEDSLVRVCVEGKWLLPDTDSDTTYVKGLDFSCKMEELPDGRGYKIVCSGDSIGVVLNGADGKNGANGKDGADGEKGDDGKDGAAGSAGSGCSMTGRTDSTVIVSCGDSLIIIDLGNPELPLDSERMPISLDSLIGFTQKGPFLKGSTVYLYELSDGRTLKQTNGNFTSIITRDDGHYKFNARDLVSQYALVVVDGFYRNEVTGTTSGTPIRLMAVTDMRKHSSVNVNVLTYLEYDRVYYLVTRKQYTVKKAKQQAQREILEWFGIELDEKVDAETMDVFGSSESDAVLLAISVLLQGDRSSANLMVVLSEISHALTETGEWSDRQADSLKATLADWAISANLVTIRKNVEGWHLGGDAEVGNFEKYVDAFIAHVLTGEVCGEGDDGELRVVDNSLSRFNGKKFECLDRKLVYKSSNTHLNEDFEYGWLYDDRDRQMYRTITIGSRVWMAENLNYDYRITLKDRDEPESYGSYCYDDDPANCNVYGRLYTWGAAMDSAGIFSEDCLGCGDSTWNLPSGTVHGICPEGWHVPTRGEIGTLATEDFHYRNAAVLRAKSGWGEDVTCSDDFGFAALPAGRRVITFSGAVQYMNLGSYAFFITASKQLSDNGTYMMSVPSDGNVGLPFEQNNDDAHSLRCVKD